MADPIYDICAITTNISGDPSQVYGTLTVTSSSGAADTASAQVEHFLNTILTSAGWTCIATNTASSRFNRDYIGLQPPWYDLDAVPSWYPPTENIPWLRVISNNSVSNIAFTVGVYNGTTGTFTNATTMNYNGAIGVGHEAHAVANPFQVVLNGTNTSGASPNRGFIFSALHVPDFVQERNQVKKCMFASSGGPAFFLRFSVADINSWTIYESNISGGVRQWFGNPNQGLLGVFQMGGGERQANATGLYTWNPTDTNMVSPSSWYPMLCPATIAWQHGTATPTSTNTPTAMGMLWDALFVNRDLGIFTTVSGLPASPPAERRDWIVMGVDTTEYNFSLIYIKGLTPP